MPMDLRADDRGLMVVRIHGVLRRAELGASQRAAARIIREAGKVSALILLEGFEGWERSDAWGDMSFLVEHDNDIEKIAIVGAERWRDDVLMFAAAGLRTSAVRYFTDSEGARAWLADRSLAGDRV